ncbi:hypothetical protein FOMPIDRAFT_1134931 [Fomitopsis schrenkii]|uniref:Uncharacterized protein n=1 Tax=Fomitopsis schrenkii TaxID=2126942 RepID=S8DSC6_FOMSC|nr:hypothetical protein FOMPIDRAFT_1134931 [Fomitopsis schrenkii]
MDEKELDQRIRCLPPAYGTRHFKNGISALSQVSGSERKDMARILLGCLVGRIPHDLMLTFRALLDFIYISQYPTHDDQTLKYLEDALEVYHKHKHILKTLGIRDHLNIPKFHSLVHYADSIRSLGTTDNYNTEMFERLHIDCAKKAWRASNHRNERPQMTKWLERREKIAMFESLRAHLHTQAWDIDADSNMNTDNGTGLFLPKHPSASRQSIPSITERHHAPGFAKALNQHIYSMKLGRRLTLQEQEIASSYLPFSRLDIYYTLKFTTIPLSTRIGRVKVIFKLPDTIYEHGSLNDMHAPEEWATQGPLAYVEWYANLPASADPVHMMYEVRKLPLRADGTPAGEIIPLSMIRQSCQLIPRFPKPKADRTTPTVPSDWTSDSVLDKAQKFLLNNWASKYAYQTLW